MEEYWYAVYTKPRFEKKVAERFSKLSIENYCPLNKVVKQWSDRKKTVEEPLFKSYVFLKINIRKYEEIRQVHGVVNFVYWLNKPAIIKPEEINIIRDFLNKHINVKLVRSAINIEDKVKILTGPFANLEGDVKEIKNKTIKVYLPSLGYEMFAEIEKSGLALISK